MYTVLITAITILGGTSAWRFYEKRYQAKEADKHWIQNDCTSRITKLEALLDQSGKEKDEMRKQILDLVAELAALRTEIKYLTKKS